MATLGDILSEIFAPQPGVGAPSRLGGPEQEPLSIPVPQDQPSNGMAPIQATPDGAFLDALRRTFMPTPQPPDGMDARTYDSGRKMVMPNDIPAPNLTAPATVEREWGPDTNEGYAPKFGFVTDGNDPAREAVMTQSVDRPTSGPAVGPGARRPVASPMRPRSDDPPPMRQAPQAEAPNELARAFRAFFAGAAGVNPTSPKFSAFSQGAAGAMKTQYDERQKEEALSRQREKDSLDRALKLTKNDRDEALADNLMGYRDRKSNADASGVRYQDINSFNQIKNNVNRDYKRALDLINKDYSLGPAEKKKAQDDAKAERDQRLLEVEQQYKQRSLTPDMGKAPQKTEPKPAQKSGDGKSPQAPVMTTDPKVIQGLPSGSYFVNPADGQVYQKN